jgi:membrane-bound serine protease (ClpP class)
MSTQNQRKSVVYFTAAILALIAVAVMPGVLAPLHAQNTPTVVSDEGPREAIAVVIPCTEMIDDGLYQSILRRSKEALDMGAEYLIFEIDTYGGLVKSADDISTYFILDLGKKAHTVAYVTHKAISAGAMISVSCQDIIMRRNTTIGDCAPITMGDSLEGVEREKAESFIRAIFSRAAEANDYPEALLKAMVTRQLEIRRVRNIHTGQYECFETEDLPKDPNTYDLANIELVDKDDEILTLTASKAKEYGIARAVVDNRAEALAFLQERDGVRFTENVRVLDTLWSEQMVRWINSPAVMAVFIMLAMLGVYIELNSPGVGLPGLVAVICIVAIVGSKYLVGMANWVEIAILVIGFVLLAVEIFVIPGFGVTGVSGIICIFAGAFGMLIKNSPDEMPWPAGRPEWDMFADQLTGLTAGFMGFFIVAFFVARYLPEWGMLRGLKLSFTLKGEMLPVFATGPGKSSRQEVAVGMRGSVISTLRPAGQAKFDALIVDVISQGEFIEEGTAVEILEIHGNRVVVKASREGQKGIA